MEKFVNTVLKHSKLIIILWVVLLLIASPFVYMYLQDPGKVVKYEITDMQGADSEAYTGMKIIGGDSPYFTASGTDYVTVCNHNNANEKTLIEEKFYPELTKRAQAKYNNHAEIAQAHLGNDDVGAVLITVSIPDGESKNEGVEFLRSTINEVKDEVGYHNDTYVTGNVALGYDISKSAMEDVMKIDPFSILLVLILIGLFFRSIISAATPPLTIGVAYAIVLMAVFFIGQVTDVFYITTTLVLISMLGAGCDYCIFIIARYREERKVGKDSDTALREALKWAGESVMVSGLCVIIGFGVMSLCSFSLVSTMGMVLAVGIIFALLAAVTLIPSIIHLVGDKIFFPTKVEAYQEGSKVSMGWYGKIGRLGQRYFSSSAKFSINHAWAIIIAAIVITAPLTYVALTESTSFDMVSTMPDSESKRGIDEITAGGNGGMTMPTYLVMDMKLDDGEELVKTGSVKLDILGQLGTMEWNNKEKGTNLMLSSWYVPNTFLKPTEGIGWWIIYQYQTKDNVSMMMGVVEWGSLIGVVQKYMPSLSYVQAERYVIDMLTENYPEVRSLYEVLLVDAPDEELRASIINYLFNEQLLNSISKKADGHQYIKLSIMFKDQPMSDKSMDTAMQIRDAAHYYETTEDGKATVIGTYTTGTTALLNDISDQVAGDFRIIEIVVIILILILLLFVMKSYLTPIRSVVTIIMSIMWTLGCTHLLFGHALGQPIIWLVPIVLFVICLGLGMDYDVLLTTRIKEYVGKGMDNDTAIARAVEHSGAIITICGFIMGGAFLSMVLSSTPMLQQFGFALGFAILIDSLIIRTYVVPAVMHLLGRWNWVGPLFLKKSVQ